MSGEAANYTNLMVFGLNQPGLNLRFTGLANEITISYRYIDITVETDKYILYV